MSTCIVRALELDVISETPLPHSRLLNFLISVLIKIRYHVPEHIAPHIDYITPGIKLTPVVKRDVKVKRGSPWFPKPSKKMPAPPSGIWNFKPPSPKNLPEDLQGCGFNMTPPCIKALYQIPNAWRQSPDNSLGLYEQGDFFAKTDIDLFLKEYAPWVPQGTYPIPAMIDGAQYGVPADSPLNTGESDVDIDMV